MLNCFNQTTATHFLMTTRHTVSNSELLYSDNCSLRKLVQAVYCSGQLVFFVAYLLPLGNNKGFRHSGNGLYKI